MNRAQQSDWKLVIFLYSSSCIFSVIFFYINFSAIKMGSLFDLLTLS